MGLIEWDNSFSVKNTEIDDQHKKWISIYNEMHTCLTQFECIDFDNITRKIIKKMQNYTSYHFNYEKDYMAKMGYPGIVDHLRFHKDFDSKIYNLARDTREGKIILNTEVIKLLKDWLLDHILVEDQKYNLYFAARKTPLTAATITSGKPSAR